MTLQPTTTLARALNGRHLLTHPFYQRWEAGELSRDELTQYAEQYRYFEALLPEFLTTLVDRLPDGAAKDSLAANVTDEVGPPSHLSLFEDFADFYDATNAAPSPAMTNLCAAYRDVLDASNAAAIAGLLAYETQGSEVALTKAVGLEEFYGASAQALKFWRVHATAEVDHAQWTLDALTELNADSMEIERGARRVAQAWWDFLDERESLAA